MYLVPNRNMAGDKRESVSSVTKNGLGRSGSRGSAVDISE